jgi:hypothetical protein
MTNQFRVAKKIDLYKKDDNGNLVDWKMKGIVDEETGGYFNTVSDGYNIVQHADLVKIVTDALADRKLNAVTKIDDKIKDNGARLQIEMTFPDITLDIGNDGQQVSLRLAYDNSHDGSTGLRLQVGARSPNSDGFLWVGGVVKASEENYYHKHTKNVSVSEFEKKLDKGIESFQTKIKNHFLGMLKVKITNEYAEVFLDTCLSMKNVSKTYIESIRAVVAKNTIKNKWQLYCLICDVISKEASSLDVRDRHLALIIGKLNDKIKSKDEEATPSSDDGATLSEAVASQTSMIEAMEAVSHAVVASKLPDGVLGLTLIKEECPTIPSKLTIEKIAKRKFAVLQGGTEIRTFKKYDQALKFTRQAA